MKEIDALNTILLITKKQCIEIINNDELLTEWNSHNLVERMNLAVSIIRMKNELIEKQKQ